MAAAAAQELFEDVPGRHVRALELVDIVGFIRVNHHWGHAVGDQIVVDLHRRLEKHVSRLAERWGLWRVDW